MDNLLLEAVVSELRSGLVGSVLQAVKEVPAGAILLLFGEGVEEANPDPEPRRGGGLRNALVIEAQAARGRLHMVRKRVPTLRSIPGGFVAQIARRLSGRILTEIRKGAGDRIVEMVFGGESLIAELIGRSANILLVDSKSNVAGFERRLESEFRRPEIGRPYEPPARRSFEEGLPRAVLEDIGAEIARGVSREQALERWTLALRSGKFQPTLYSRCAPEEMPFDRVPPEDELFALPLPLIRPPAGLLATTCKTVNETVELFFHVKARAQDFVRRREGIAAILRRESMKLARLKRNLEGDLLSMPPAGSCRRQAEALLAGLRYARRVGPDVFVPDPYDESAAEIRVHIDPALSIQQNADRLFRQEKKRHRGHEMVSRRLAATASRTAAVEELEAGLASASEPARLAAIEVELGELGFVLAPDRPLARAKAPREGREAAVSAAPPRLAGVRRYSSSDGFEILVGKTGRENDRLTFQIAAPEDFWFHAAGVAGAHVVVRNPHRLPSLPRRTLEEAARIAAFFSRAAGGGKVEVHTTRRKNVRRAKRSPPGTVVLKRFDSITVQPACPPGGLEGG